MRVGSEPGCIAGQTAWILKNLRWLNRSRRLGSLVSSWLNWLLLRLGLGCGGVLGLRPLKNRHRMAMAMSRVVLLIVGLHRGLRLSLLMELIFLVIMRLRLLNLRLGDWGGGSWLGRLCLRAHLSLDLFETHYLAPSWN